MKLSVLILGFSLFLSLPAMSQHDHNELPDPATLDPRIVKAFPSADPAVQAIRKAVVEKLYNGLIYPGPVDVLKGINPIDDIFERQVIKGRVSPAGSYEGFTSAMEYFYALALTPVTRIDKISFKSLVASDDKVAVEVDLHLCRLPYKECEPEVPISSHGTTLKESGFFTFNEDNRIISFDLVIPNLGAAFDIQNNKLAEEAAIVQICSSLTVLEYNAVTGKTKAGGSCRSNFDSPDDFPVDSKKYGTSPFRNCIRFMHSIPYGSWSRANSNTVVCRQLHSLLTPLRPDVHCAHVSADGGGKCVDVPYSSYFDQDF